MPVKVSFSNDFLSYFNLSKYKIEEETQIRLAIILYLEQEISIGKAAELSGLGYHQFEDELKQRNIKKLIGPETVEEAEMEFIHLKSLIDK